MGIAVGGEAPRRLCWVWPFRHQRSTGDGLYRLAGLAAPLVAGWRWPFVAVAVGVLPLALGYLLGTSAHQPLTALLLGPLFWACVRDDRQGKALGVVGLVVGSHSLAAIALAATDPTASAILPGSEEYGRQTLHWVRTGEDPEYEPAYWVPVHLGLLAGVVLLAYTSLGVLPLLHGLRQVDLMNFYVGRLIAESQSPWVALAAGWHPWSVLRGLSYACLVYEITSLSLERLTGRTLSTPRRRMLRWGVGLSLAVADAGMKVLTLPLIRSILHANLAP
jgi:hypothetical protein